VASQRTEFEKALGYVKRMRLTREDGGEAPNCFISYAWGEKEHEKWVLRLARDLQKANINVIFDRWHNPPGGDIDRFTERIMSSEFVVVIGTPLLKEKYESETTDPVVASELELINLKLRKKGKFGEKVIPLLLDGQADTALTPKLEKLAHIDFRPDVDYFAPLMDLILKLYDIPFDNSRVDEIRESLRWNAPGATPASTAKA